jgi:hypothetical protein
VTYFWGIVLFVLILALIGEMAGPKDTTKPKDTAKRPAKGTSRMVLGEPLPPPLPASGYDPSFMDFMAYGNINPALICPHCGEKGKVHAKKIKRRTGISGGKAVGAIATGGLSLLATGISRKEPATQAYCGNCRSNWMF